MSSKAAKRHAKKAAKRAPVVHSEPLPAPKPVPEPVQTVEGPKDSNSGKDTLHWLESVQDASNVANWHVWKTECGRYQVIRSIHRHDPEDRRFLACKGDRKDKDCLIRRDLKTLEAALACCQSHLKATLAVEMIHSNWKQVVTDAGELASLEKELYTGTVTIPPTNVKTEVTLKTEPPQTPKKEKETMATATKTAPKKTMSREELNLPMPSAGKNKKPSTVSKKVAKAAPKKRGGGDKPGVTSFIEDCLRKASKSAPITLSGIVAKLSKEFPERDAKGMSHTVYVQVTIPKYSQIHKKGLKVLGTKEKGFWLGK